ncbi:MAG TPA: hypothetical protein ENG88_01640, partial [Nitrospirae bacterium]|nr:hypothetical protein [Nitrospirota bacterium]
MKRILLMTILIVGLTATYSFADMGGHMGSDQSSQGMMGSSQGMMSGQSQQQTGDSDYYPCRQMMGGSGMMRGMMGGSGMMRGMMGGSGMMGGKYSPEAYKKYLDETVDLRKKLLNKKFEYSEAIRNPDTTRKSRLKLEKEM